MAEVKENQTKGDWRLRFGKTANCGHNEHAYFTSSFHGDLGKNRSSVPLACPTRQIMGMVLRWDRKNRSPVSHLVWPIKALPYSKAIGTEQRPQFCSPLPSMHGDFSIRMNAIFRRFRMIIQPIILHIKCWFSHHLDQLKILIFWFSTQNLKKKKNVNSKNLSYTDLMQRTVCGQDKMNVAWLFVLKLVIWNNSIFVSKKGWPSMKI